MEEELHVVGEPVDEARPLPVPAGPRAVGPRETAAPPGLRHGVVVRPRAAAVAVGGFVAGAATAAVLVRAGRGGRRAPVRARPRRGKGVAPGAHGIVGSRSFLVDVHLLGRG